MSAWYPKTLEQFKKINEQNEKFNKGLNNPKKYLSHEEIEIAKNIAKDAYSEFAKKLKKPYSLSKKEVFKLIIGTIYKERFAEV